MQNDKHCFLSYKKSGIEGVLDYFDIIFSENLNRRLNTESVRIYVLLY